ncbi:MAG TPA: NAD-dependent epimerase/dehydratase family protein, partial [Candidatus Dormibacteraeota bacterium]|nr:NAD-dependent epimerase/dehydratase family protein [Candidatus Dormibacteraeota bacterium]
MHLVIGAGEFLGRHVTRAMADDVPVIELNADADEQTLSDAIGGVEVVVFAAQTVSPGRRIRFRRGEPHALARVVDAARRARVRRIVHVSTADVFGPDHFARVTEKSRIKPAHAFEKQKLFEEEWLLANSGDVEVVVIRPARVFGAGEEWMMPRLMAASVRGRLWLPGGGRAKQTFVSAEDVGRACLAASDRGRPGHRYLVGGFDSTWREFLVSAARAVGFAAEIASMPYDLAYARALAAETVTAQGAAVWPGIYAIDVMGKPHHYDDSYSRRELTWSPSTGSFEQEMPAMAPW